MQYAQKTFSGNKILLYAWFQAMFTRVDLMLYDDIERQDLISIAHEIEKEIVRIESFTNRFDENSLLSHVNRNAYHESVKLTPELFKILADCQLYKEQTSGYFDIATQMAGLKQIGVDEFVLDTENCSVKFLYSTVKLDLSGYIKGYALGSVIRLLKEKNIANALINIGNSSIFAMGNHPAGEGWKVAVPATNLECVLKNECLTTSGNSVDTKWPIINPLTGNAAEIKLPVSVITADPAIGEVLSKVANLAPEAELDLLLRKFNARLVN